MGSRWRGRRCQVTPDRGPVDGSSTRAAKPTENVHNPPTSQKPVTAKLYVPDLAGAGHRPQIAPESLGLREHHPSGELTIPEHTVAPGNARGLVMPRGTRTHNTNTLERSQPSPF